MLVEAEDVRGGQTPCVKACCRRGFYWLRVEFGVEFIGRMLEGVSEFILYHRQEREARGERKA